MAIAVRRWTWGAYLACVGIVLAMPAIVWPTWALVRSPGFEPGVGLHFWSWGSLEFFPPGGAVNVVRDPPVSLLPLAAHAVVLTWALALSVVGLMARGARARVLGAAAAGAAWALVVKALVERSAEYDHWVPDVTARLDLGVATLPAGIAENAAVVVLTVALTLMLWGPIRACSAQAWRQLSAWARAAREREEAAVRDTGVSAGGIVFRGERGSDGTFAGSANPDDGVALTDAPPDDDAFGPRA